MSRHLSRLVALALCVGFGAHLVGVPFALAATGSVRGRVIPESGPVPSGCTVRATPLDGGAPTTVAVGSDGTFQMAQLPEGAYKFEVLGPGGTLLGPATKTLVSPMQLQLNLRVKAIPAAATAPPPAALPPAAQPPAKLPPAAQPPAVPTPPAQPPVKPPTQAPQPKPPEAPRASRPARGVSTASNKKKWAVIGAIVGGLGVGLAAGNSGNNNASPSQP